MVGNFVVVDCEGIAAGSARKWGERNIVKRVENEDCGITVLR